jgi:nucleoside 2-deoxyribosyltransferase
MKVYLASRYSRAQQNRLVRADLQALGHTVTSRWIDGGHELTKEGSRQSDHAERIRFAQEDWADLMAADCVISFTEEPRQTNARGGRHVEFGAALATGKRVIVIGWRENVFHCLPQVEFFETWEEAFAALSPSEAQVTP